MVPQAFLALCQLCSIAGVDLPVAGSCKTPLKLLEDVVTERRPRPFKFMSYIGCAVDLLLESCSKAHVSVDRNAMKAFVVRLLQFPVYGAEVEIYNSILSKLTDQSNGLHPSDIDLVLSVLIVESGPPDGLRRILTHRKGQSLDQRFGLFKSVAERENDSSLTLEYMQILVSVTQKDGMSHQFSSEMGDEILKSFLHGCSYRCVISFGERLPVKIAREMKIIAQMQEIIDVEASFKRIDGLKHLAEVFSSLSHQDGAHVDVVFDSLIGSFKARFA